MRVLIVHNFYRSSAPSGENDAVLSHLEELKNEGHIVETYFVKSDWLVPLKQAGGALAGITYITGIMSFFPLLWKIIRFKPEIVHIHNLFPLISPWVLLWLPRLVNTFYTFHNYRNFCAGGIPIRNGRHCDLCLTGSQSNALKYRCYRKSIIATFPIYLMNVIIERLGLLNNCKKVVVLNNFKKKFLIARGILEEKIIIKGNYINEITVSKNNSKEYIFVGRLTEEKGIENLLYFWNISETKNILHIYGSGELEKSLKSAYQSDTIIFHGLSQFKKILLHMKTVKAILVPSLCIEGYPMVIAQAQSIGIPIVVTDIGPLPEISGNNKLVISYDDFLNRDEKLIPFFKNLSEEIDSVITFTTKKSNKRMLDYDEIYKDIY